MTSSRLEYPQDPYALISERLTPIVENELSNTDPVNITTMCEFCLRPGDVFDNEGVIWVDSYKYNNHICKTCNLFSEQYADALGLERGTIGYKLSSFKSGFLALPMNNTLPVELWLGGKYLDRINLNGGFKIIDRSGNQAKYDLCERIGEYSVITEITLRREMFLRHIRLSDTANTYLSNETGSIRLNRTDYQALKHAFISENFTNKELLDAITTINAYKTGSISSLHARTQELFGRLSHETRLALGNITDPASLMFMLAGFKAGLIKEEVK